MKYKVRVRLPWRSLISILTLLIVLTATGLHFAPALRGNTPCAGPIGAGDGCLAGGSFKVPDFFRGYATKGSARTAYPAGSTFFVPWTATVSHQPDAYPTRPPWKVAGVDYAVGLPQPLAPTLSNLSGQPNLKDPARIATDPLANPDGAGTSCTFVASNAAVPRGVAAGGTSNPFPFPNDGPGIYCTHQGGSRHPLIFDGYNFGWNSRTGYGCVPIYITGANWGAGAAQNGPTTASIIFRNSLFVNGPKCNIWGEIGVGSNQAGPNSPSSAVMINIGLSAGKTNTLGFYNNTVYGCGGDSLASPLETALCSASFNATSYAVGPNSGFARGATVGVAPFQSNVMNFGGIGTMWVQDNAFIHIASRFANPVYANFGASQIITNNYIEGMTYTIGPHIQIASIVNTGGTTETITTVAPHGVPVGSHYAIVFSGGGAPGFPAGWSRDLTTMATGPNTLTFASATNYGDWTYAGSGSYPVGIGAGNHGEFTIHNGSLAGATFTGTISGKTLSVSGLAGTLAVGQYVTAATGSGLSIPSPTYIVSGAGTTWTLNQAPGNMSGPMVSPYYTIGAKGQATDIRISYNTFLMTPSTAGDANTAFFYVSTGGAYANNGIPLVQFTGSIDHNVMVNDLTPGLTHRSTSALVEFAYNATGAFSITDNYVDPTGAFYCWPQMQEDPSDGVTIANNVNLLDPSDPYVNLPDFYSIVPYVPGTKSNTQAENGINYNSATGMVTVRLSNAALPPGFGVGSRFTIHSSKVTAGTNYLLGIHTVAGVSGNTFTFRVPAGNPGAPVATEAAVEPFSSNGGRQSCYGHN